MAASRKRPAKRLSHWRWLNMNSIALTKKIVDRFWRNVRILGENDCWEWKASTYKKSRYGRFSIKRKNLLTHRVSWVIANSEEIPFGLMVLHKCDNPPCCNPKHLFLGTQTENMQDMASKGRTKISYGEHNFLAKLKEKDIPKILSLLSKGVSQKEIAKIFGVTQTTISRVKVRETWSWVK